MEATNRLFDALEQSFGSFLGNRNLTLFIPVYQRTYKWEEKHAYDFYHDILKSKSPYFIGEIITTETKADEYEIVDGQQRMATFFILMSSLARVAKHYINVIEKMRSSIDYMIENEKSSHFEIDTPEELYLYNHLISTNPTLRKTIKLVSKTKSTTILNFDYAEFDENRNHFYEEKSDLKIRLAQLHRVYNDIRDKLLRFDGMPKLSMLFENSNFIDLTHVLDMVFTSENLCDRRKKIYITHEFFYSLIKRDIEEETVTNTAPKRSEDFVLTKMKDSFMDTRFIVVVSKQKSNSYLFYSRLNDRGEPIQPIDIVKALMMHYSIECPLYANETNVESIIERRWRALLKNLKVEAEVGSKEKGNRFLRNYVLAFNHKPELSIMNKQINKNNSGNDDLAQSVKASDLPTAYDLIIQKNYEVDNIEDVELDVLQDLMTKSAYYGFIINELSADDTNDELNRSGLFTWKEEYIMSQIKYLRNTKVDPALLLLTTVYAENIKKYKNGKRDYHTLLEFFKKLSIRKAIGEYPRGSSGVKSYFDLVKTFINNPVSSAYDSISVYKANEANYTLSDFVLKEMIVSDQSRTEELRKYLLFKMMESTVKDKNTLNNITKLYKDVMRVQGRGKKWHIGRIDISDKRHREKIGNMIIISSKLRDELSGKLKIMDRLQIISDNLGDVIGNFKFQYNKRTYSLASLRNDKVLAESNAWVDVRSKVVANTIIDEVCNMGAYDLKES